MSAKNSGWTVILALLVSVPVAVYGGWLFSFVWQWFIADVFHVQTLRAVDAIGLQYVIGWLTHNVARKETEGGPLAQMAGFALGYTLIFGIAALVHAFQ